MREPQPFEPPTEGCSLCLGRGTLTKGFKSHKRTITCWKCWGTGRQPKEPPK